MVLSLNEYMGTTFYIFANIYVEQIYISGMIILPYIKETSGKPGFRYPQNTSGNAYILNFFVYFIEIVENSSFVKFPGNGLFCLIPTKRINYIYGGIIRRNLIGSIVFSVGSPAYITSR